MDPDNFDRTSSCRKVRAGRESATLEERAATDAAYLIVPVVSLSSLTYAHLAVWRPSESESTENLIARHRSELVL